MSKVIKAFCVILALIIIGELVYYYYNVYSVQRVEENMQLTNNPPVTTPPVKPYFNPNSCGDVYAATLEANNAGFVTSSIEIDNFEGLVDDVVSDNDSISLTMKNDKSSYTYKYIPSILEKTKIYSGSVSDENEIAFTDLQQGDKITVEVRYDLLIKALEKTYGEGLISVVIVRAEENNK